jgi:predicted dehydrogenase
VNQPVRVAVVGLAGMGQSHLFAVHTLGDHYQLVGVHDVDSAVAAKAATDWHTRAFATFEELAASGVAEAAIIVVPPFLHGSLTRQALEAGLHVYCEKPMVATVGEGRQLTAAAVAAGKVVQVGLQYRFLPSYVRAAELLASGAIGEVFRANLTATNWFRPQHYFDSRPWRARWRTVGGGALLHHSIHQLDAYVSMVGQPVRVMARAFRSIHDVEVEDEVTALVELANGGRGVVVASTADPVGANRIEIHAEAGSLVAEGHSLRRATFAGSPVRSLSALSQDDFSEIVPQWSEEVTPIGGEDFTMLLDCHRDFVAAIRAGTLPRNHPAEAIRAVEVANAIYLSAVREQPVDLPVDADEYAACFEDLAAGRRRLPRAGH